MNFKQLLIAIVFSAIGLGNALANEPTAQLNLNTASAEQLDELKGVGISKSAAIVKYRQQNGNFKNVEQIVLVPGIGEKIYLDNKDRMYVD
ncbi:ComEA family DNA-binding protein [Agarivorans sp. DSG3-1]|uniref:ComEA family DNA-binding protein n=1 Tax=Agarivorans sp. DSG3-1 TaxID=3342249 RepID=UPI00398F5431